MGQSAYNAGMDRQLHQQELDERKRHGDAERKTQELHQQKLAHEINKLSAINTAQQAALQGSREAFGLQAPADSGNAVPPQMSSVVGMALPTQSTARAPVAATGLAGPTAGATPGNAQPDANAKKQAQRKLLHAQFEYALLRGDPKAQDYQDMLAKFDYTDALNAGTAQRRQAIKDHPELVDQWAQRLTSNDMPITHDGVDPKTGIHTLTLMDRKGKPYRFKVSPEQAARADAAYELMHNDPRFADFGQADLDRIDTKLGAMIQTHNAVSAQLNASGNSAYSAQSGRISALADQSRAGATNRQVDAQIAHLASDQVRITNPQSYVTQDANGNTRITTGGMRLTTKGPNAGNYEFATIDTPNNMVPAPMFANHVDKIESGLSGLIPRSVPGSLVNGKPSTWEANPELRHTHATKLALQTFGLTSPNPLAGIAAQMRAKPLPGSNGPVYGLARPVEPSAPAEANPMPFGLHADPASASPNYPGGELQFLMPRAANGMQINPTANWPGGQPRFMPGLFGR